MLSVDAVRLAGVEVLCPTSAVLAHDSFPTLAGIHVFDSRAVALQDIDPERAFTPVLSLRSGRSSATLRGPHAAPWDSDADTILEVIAELAVVAGDDGGNFADAMAGDDPDARLVLGALCAQVRSLFERSQRGGLWRRLVKQITEVEYIPYEIPDLGMRWQRMTMRYHLDICDDQFDMGVGGLPEPIKSLFDALPDESYAKAKLSALAAHFAAEPLPALTEISGTIGSVEAGLKNLSP
ncbi:hypothetical protein [Rhizobium sp. CNPSo 4039]|uniref:hypothetical protein n=1 Tax=Rhizobium sp. CNPSo 4039 TaxID=3021409 RepID=UPI00254CA9D6|nr:hypothetical protein [Rhizobium sp. CNPSo 4039]MDK4712995.1 hypothetical protein [Rhizobium sp. CNPSo 4039]